MSPQEYQSYLREFNQREARLNVLNKKFKKLNSVLKKVQTIRDDALTKLLAEEEHIGDLKRLLEL